MKYYPAEIAKKRFERKMMGYDMDQVEDYLVAIAAQMEAFVQERDALKSALRDKELELIQHRDKEQLLQSTFTHATQMSEKMKDEAEREARLIVKDAEDKADKITFEARESLRKLYKDISDMKRARMQFEANIKAMAQAHLSLLDQGDTFMPRMTIPNLDLE